MLNQHFETIEVYGYFESRVFDAISDAALKINPEVTILKGNEQLLTVAGSGFVLKQINDPAKAQAQTEMPKTTYSLAGEISPLTLLETLPIFAAAHQAAGSDGIVGLKWDLRRQVGMPTRDAQILAHMRGTPLRFLHEHIFDYNGLIFKPSSYNANHTQGKFLIVADPEAPYRPPDIRFRINLNWTDVCPEQAIRSLLMQLFERNIITTDTRTFELRE